MRHCSTLLCSLVITAAACSDSETSPPVTGATDSGTDQKGDASAEPPPRDGGGVVTGDAANPPVKPDATPPPGVTDAAMGAPDSATTPPDAGGTPSPTDAGSDEPDAAPDAATDVPVDSGPGNGSNDSGPGTREFTLRVLGLDLTPIAGASVCLFPAGAPCATADTNSVIALGGLPKDKNLLLEVSGTGHIPGLRLVQAGSADLNLNSHLLTETLATAVALGFLGRTLSDARGHLVVRAFDGQSRSVGLAGVTVGLRQLAEDGSQVPGNGGALEVYAAEDFSPNLGLVETTSSGTFLALDMAPGTYIVTLDHPTRSCDDPFPTSSWGTKADGSIPAPVAAGHQSALAVHCN